MAKRIIEATRMWQAMLNGKKTFVLSSLSKFELCYGETNRKEMKFAFSI